MQIQFSKKRCVLSFDGLPSFLKAKNYLLYFGKAEKFHFFDTACICNSIEG